LTLPFFLPFAGNKAGQSMLRRRFDHIFASQGLRTVSCQYLTALHEDGLSDQAPIEAVFEA
jgi:hypothetical protein